MLDASSVVGCEIPKHPATKKFNTLKFLSNKLLNISIGDKIIYVG